jgi:hypothetical protein
MRRLRRYSTHDMRRIAREGWHARPAATGPPAARPPRTPGRRQLGQAPTTVSTSPDTSSRRRAPRRPQRRRRGGQAEGPRAGGRGRHQAGTSSTVRTPSAHEHHRRIPARRARAPGRPRRALVRRRGRPRSRSARAQTHDGRQATAKLAGHSHVDHVEGQRSGRRGPRRVQESDIVSLPMPYSKLPRPGAAYPRRPPLATPLGQFLKCPTPSLPAGRKSPFVAGRPRSGHQKASETDSSTPRGRASKASAVSVKIWAP